MKKIGFIGLGSMGMPMAQNLLKHGFEVTGFDLSVEKKELLRQYGGQTAETLPELAVGQDYIILMVVNYEQVEDVILNSGLLESIEDHTTIIMMATCPSDQIADLSKRIASRKAIKLLDAPVSGGVAGAIAGTLTVMAAGDEAVFEEAKPVFEAVGSRIYHVGPEIGQGSMTKTVNQLLCGVHIAATAEAFALASKVNIDLSIILDIMSESSVSSWMLKDRGPRMLKEQPEITSAVDIFVKDLGIVLNTGNNIRTALPIAACAHQMFLAASGLGYAKEDDSQVIRSYYAMNNISDG